METDVDMREDKEMGMLLRTSTPRQGSAHSHGLLTPNATTVVTPPNKPDLHPCTRTTKSINPELTYGQTPDTPHPWTHKSPGSVLSPEQRPAVEAPAPKSGYYNLRESVESRISSPATEKEIANAPDSVKPRPDSYVRHRSMVSIDKVDEARNALLAHMRTRFRPSQDSTLPVQDATDFPLLPPPSSMLAHRQQSNLPNQTQRLPQPNFQTPRHLTIKSHHQIQSLSGILAAERTKNHNARDLAGLTFHHVVQQPFTNELRAHYTANSSSSAIVRGITMYRLQLPVAENTRETMNKYGRQTEMWYSSLSQANQPQGTMYIRCAIRRNTPFRQCRPRIWKRIRVRSVRFSKRGRGRFRRGEESTLLERVGGLGWRREWLWTILGQAFVRIFRMGAVNCSRGLKSEGTVMRTAQYSTSHELAPTVKIGSWWRQPPLTQTRIITEK